MISHINIAILYTNLTLLNDSDSTSKILSKLAVALLTKIHDEIYPI